MATIRSEAYAPTGVAKVWHAVIAFFTLVLRTNTGRIGLAVVGIHVVLALIGPWITPFPPTEYHIQDQYSSPTSTYWLGTDEKGRDIFSRVLAGARSIIWIATAGTILGVTFGTIVGVTSGYLGGRIDQVIMRIVDWFLAIPSLLLAILVINMATQRFRSVDESFIIIGIIGISFMPNNSRVIRSATLAIKPLEFVQSARLRGEPTLYIMFREVLPNVLPVVGVEATIRLSFALLLTAGLGFLGLGVQPPEPDWGKMVSENAIILDVAPLASLAPGIAMASLVVGINLLADGIRQAQNLPETGDR
ncbi:MAG: ABC transporter permease [Dehalococcoidia bacterium]|nr:ABC transporter permease [Dehalococcoidia bacterium]